MCHSYFYPYIRSVIQEVVFSHNYCISFTMEFDCLSTTFPGCLICTSVLLCALVSASVPKCKNFQLTYILAARKSSYKSKRICRVESSHGGMCNHFKVKQAGAEQCQAQAMMCLLASKARLG